MQQHLEPAPRSLVVIVVDDDAAVRNSLKFVLELEGFGVRTYASAQQLLSETELTDCDCLVVDQNMPDMNGLELIAKLRSRNVRSPAILITSHPNPAMRASATERDIAIVEKPLFGSVLLDGIRQVTMRPSP